MSSKNETAKVENVIIADDHVFYRAGVKTALSSKKDIKVIAEADNGSHLLILLKAIQPDVILLDIQMPIMDGIATLAEVKKLYPKIKIIMLTMMDDHSMITKLMDELRSADEIFITNVIAGIQPVSTFLNKRYQTSYTEKIMSLLGSTF